MIIKEVRVAVRMSRSQSYQSAATEIEFLAAVEEGEDVEQVYAALRDRAEGYAREDTKEQLRMLLSDD